MFLILNSKWRGLENPKICRRYISMVHRRTTTTTTRRVRNPPKFRGLAVINAAYVTLKGRDDLSVVETAPVGTRLARDGFISRVNLI